MKTSTEVQKNFNTETGSILLIHESFIEETAMKSPLMKLAQASNEEVSDFIKEAR